MTETLDELQRWYASQCDGNWEHTYGIKIATLDNPGWTVVIELAETELEKRPFVSIMRRAPDQDWIVCEVVEHQFRGSGGPTMLTRILRIFLDWTREERGIPGFAQK